MVKKVRAFMCLLLLTVCFINAHAQSDTSTIKRKRLVFGLQLMPGISQYQFDKQNPWYNLSNWQEQEVSFQPKLSFATGLWGGIRLYKGLFWITEIRYSWVRGAVIYKDEFANWAFDITFRNTEFIPISLLYRIPAWGTFVQAGWGTQQVRSQLTKVDANGQTSQHENKKEEPPLRFVFLNIGKEWPIKNAFAITTSLGVQREIKGTRLIDFGGYNGLAFLPFSYSQIRANFGLQF